MIGSLVDNVLGALELVRLAVLTRFRFSGAYWQWRMHTAFGSGPRPSRMDMARAALAYGRWARRMRRLRAS